MIIDQGGDTAVTGFDERVSAEGHKKVFWLR
jgi:hypothetical protein